MRRLLICPKIKIFEEDMIKFKDKSKTKKRRIKKIWRPYKLGILVIMKLKDS